MKITQVIVLVACFVALGVPALGQKKTIDQREYFNTVYGKPINPWYQRNHRVERSREDLVDGVVARTATTISEEVLPDRHRYYSKTVENGTTIERDSITIEYFNYTRENGGQWKKTDLRKSGANASDAGGTGAGSMACSQYSVESAFISGMPVKVFEKVVVMTMQSLLVFVESRIWIGEDGTPYREEEVTGNLSPRIERSRTTTTYDYSPDIKIEAPTL